MSGRREASAIPTELRRKGNSARLRDYQLRVLLTPFSRKRRFASGLSATRKLSRNGLRGDRAREPHSHKPTYGPPGSLRFNFWIAVTWGTWMSCSSFPHNVNIKRSTASSGVSANGRLDTQSCSQREQQKKAGSSESDSAGSKQLNGPTVMRIDTPSQLRSEPPSSRELSECNRHTKRGASPLFLIEIQKAIERGR